MPDDAKLGLLAGVIAVVAVAVATDRKPPDPPRPAPPAVMVARTPPATAAVPVREPLELDGPIPTRPDAPAAPASYTRP